MKKTFARLSFLILYTGSWESHAQVTLPDPAPGPATSAHYYYENHGQIIDEAGNAWPSIKYYSENGRERLFFAAAKIHHTLRIPGDSVGSTLAPDTMLRLDVRFDCRVEGEGCGTMRVYEQSADFLNYFLPHCGSSGITGVRGWKTIAYENAFPGIDVRYTADATGPVMYFVIHPGANPSDIRLIMNGQDSLLQWVGGSLRAALGQQSIVFPKGRVYQINAAGQPYVIPPGLATWVKLNNSTVGFSIGSYNPAQTLVIKIAKPVTVTSTGGNDNLEWLTYYGEGGSENKGRMKADANGDLYHAMMILGQGFSSIPGAQQPNWIGGTDYYVTKFYANASRHWATYYGGNGNETVGEVGVSAGTSGEVFIAGSTKSTTIPTAATSSSYTQSANSGTLFSGASIDDGFIAALNKQSGHRTWATYFGSTGQEAITALDVNDAEGKLFIAGWVDNQSATATAGCNTPPSAVGQFPLCAGPASPARYYDATSNGGLDCFVAEFDLVAKNLLWSTFFGGDSNDEPSDIITHGSGAGLSIFMTGKSTSANAIGSFTADRTSTAQGIFPIADPGAGAYVQSYKGGSGVEGFITGFNAARRLAYSSFFGGGGIDEPTSLAVNSAGDVYLAGFTTSAGSVSGTTPNTAGEFPTYAGVAFGTSLGGRFYQRDLSVLNNYKGKNNGYFDAFVSRFSNNGVLKWSSLLGGSGSETSITNTNRAVSLAVDGGGNVYVCGPTFSINAPGATNNFPVIAVGGVYNQPNNKSAGTTHPGQNDVWLSLFSPTDALRWSTFFGETSNDSAFSGSTAFEAPTDLSIGGAAPAEKLFITGATRDFNLRNLTLSPAPGAYYDNIFSNAGGQDENANLDVFVGRFAIAPLATSVGQPEAAGTLPLTVRPNPSTGMFVVDCKVGTTIRDARVTVTNAVGQVVISHGVTIASGANRFGVDLAGLPAGVYLLHVDAGAEKAAAKLIKQ